MYKSKIIKVLQYRLDFPAYWGGTILHVWKCQSNIYKFKMLYVPKYFLEYNFFSACLITKHVENVNFTFTILRLLQLFGIIKFHFREICINLNFVFQDIVKVQLFIFVVQLSTILVQLFRNLKFNLFEVHGNFTQV